MAAPILEDARFGITVGAASGEICRDESLGFSGQRPSPLLALRWKQRVEEAQEQYRAGSLTQFHAPKEVPKVGEFELKLEVLGPDETVLQLVYYLDEAARLQGKPFLRQWLKEASQVRLSEDLRVAALAMLFPARTSLPEYSEFLEASRKQLLESMGTDEVTALLEGYE